MFEHTYTTWFFTAILAFQRSLERNLDAELECTGHAKGINYDQTSAEGVLHKGREVIVIHLLRIGVSKSPVFDFLRHSPTHRITKMIMIIANTAAIATTTYSHTWRGVVSSGSVELSVTIFDVGDVGGLLVSGEVEGKVTSPVVTVGGGVGRGLEFRLGCDVISVWVVEVISSMGVGVTGGEGSTVMGILAQLSVWKKYIVD